MNSSILIGRLTKDPEVRYTNSDKAVCKVVVAVDRFSNGKKEADFIPVTIFGKQAESLAKYQKKGNRIGVQGSIRTGSYEKQDGTKVYTTEVVANMVEYYDFNDAKENASQTSQSNDTWHNDGFEPVNPEEIPF